MSSSFKLFNIDMESIRASFNITCAVLGIGSLSMGHNFAQAGPLYASLAFFLMCFFNVYATVALSKCLSSSPSHVQTYGDLGEHLLGKWGRYIVVITQFGTCLLIPIAFLVLGGAIILPLVFREVWPSATANIWIPLMTLFLLPTVLIRSLKEGAYVALIGAAGAFFGDFIAVVDSLQSSSYYLHSDTQVSLKNVVTVFGSMSLAYGAAVVIPSIQRDHSNPQKLPTVITWNFIGITIIYLTMGVLSFYQYGCVAPDNLLLASSATRVITKIGLLFFFIHIAIAFAVLLHPVLYIFERNLLGFNRSPLPSLQSPSSTLSVHLNEKSTKHIGSLILEEGKVSRTWRQTFQSFVLRISVVLIQMFFAMFLQSSFDDFADFIGATSITASCIVIPCYLYYVQFKNQLALWEKFVCWFIIVTSCLLGCYSALSYLQNMIHASSKYELFTSHLPQPGDVSTQLCKYKPLKQIP